MKKQNISNFKKEFTSFYNSEINNLKIINGGTDHGDDDIEEDNPWPTGPVRGGGE